MHPERVARESPQAIRALEQWHTAVPSAVTQSAAGTQLKKRGLETRARLLDVAIRCLADSGGAPVSTNRIAKDAGVTWGTVQHQFGDPDGLWVAVITEIHSRSWISKPDNRPSRSGTLRERVGNTGRPPSSSPRWCPRQVQTESMTVPFVVGENRHLPW